MKDVRKTASEQHLEENEEILYGIFKACLKLMKIQDDFLSGRHGTRKQLAAVLDEVVNDITSIKAQVIDS